MSQVSGNRTPNRAAVVHVIDDEQAVRFSLAFVLECEGIEVRTYASAATFLTAMLPDIQGCIVTDIGMPGMSGIELLRRLKAMGVTLPAIAMTGHPDALVVAEAIRSGAIDCIRKPFSDDSLLTAIRSALREPAAPSEH